MRHYEYEIELVCSMDNLRTRRESVIARAHVRLILEEGQQNSPDVQRWLLDQAGRFRNSLITAVVRPIDPLEPTEIK